MVIKILLVTLTCFLAQPSPRTASPTEDWDWRADKSCGQISGYIYIKLLGVDASLADVRKQISSGADGSSLVDIARCCRLYGAKASLRRISSGELTRLRFPVIAHFNGPRGEEQGSVDHFVTVVSADNNNVRIIDPSWSFAVKVVGFSEFSDVFSGYIIAETKGDLARDVASAAAIGTATLLVGYLGLGLTRRLPWPRLSPAAVVLLTSVVGCGQGENPTKKNESNFTKSTGIEAKVTQINLGLIGREGDHSGTFTLRNVGVRPADLELGEPTCQCTLAKLERSHLEPGEQTTLRMSFRNDLKAGTSAAAVYLGVAGTPARQDFRILGYSLGFNLPDEIGVRFDREDSVQTFTGTYYESRENIKFALEVVPKIASDHVVADLDAIQSQPMTGVYEWGFTVKVATKGSLSNAIQSEGVRLVINAYSDNASESKIVKLVGLE